MYRCRLYHQTGRSACYCNTIDETPLVSVIVKKIQEKYLSDTALSRLRRALERELERSRPRPQDLKQLKTQIEKLGIKIDNAEDACLDAPPSLRPGLYRKLEQLHSDRDRLNAELESLARHDTRSNGQDGSEIDKAIETLHNLGEALKRAKPEDTKELLSSIVTRIELFYDHEQTKSGRKTSEFSYGVIYLRPDAGEGRGASTDGPSKSTHLIKKGPSLERPRRQLVLRINGFGGPTEAPKARLLTSGRHIARHTRKWTLPSCVGR